MSVALNFLLARLWRPLLVLLSRFGRYVGNNPALSIFLLIGTVVGLSVWLFNTRSDLKQTRRDLASEQRYGDSLLTVNAKLHRDKDNAFDYADSLNQNAYALKDSLRRVVSALPASERTKLNRKLLAELDLN